VVVRRVFKQLPVEMLQQCSNASSCMWTRIVTKEHCTVYQNSTPFLPNGPRRFSFLVFRMQYISDVIMVPCYMNFT
jgi:hypothetical protein